MDYLRCSAGLGGPRSRRRQPGLQDSREAIQAEGVRAYTRFISSLLDITDNILFEYKKEQISIIHAIVNGNRKSTKLNNPDEKASFEF